MSDADNVQPEEETPSLFDQNEGVDWLLAYVIGLAEKDMSLSVIVTVGGQVISGIVISGRKYIDEITAQMKAATVNGAPDEAGSWGEAMASMFGDFKQVYAPKDDIAEEIATKRNYLHLQDVSIVMGNQTHSFGVWRIQLSRVDGFTFGTWK